MAASSCGGGVAPSPHLDFTLVLAIHRGFSRMYLPVCSLSPDFQAGPATPQLCALGPKLLPHTQGPLSF